MSKHKFTWPEIYIFVWYLTSSLGRAAAAARTEHETGAAARGVPAVQLQRFPYHLLRHSLLLSSTRTLAHHLTLYVTTLIAFEH